MSSRGAWRVARGVKKQKKRQSQENAIRVKLA
jgi:hypothetical protein